MATDITTSTHEAPSPCLSPWRLGHVLPVHREACGEDNFAAPGISFRTLHARSCAGLLILGPLTPLHLVSQVSPHLVLHVQNLDGTVSDVLISEIQNALLRSPAEMGHPNGDVEILERGSTPPDLPWKRRPDCAWCCGEHPNQSTRLHVLRLPHLPD